MDVWTSEGAECQQDGYEAQLEGPEYQLEVLGFMRGAWGPARRVQGQQGLGHIDVSLDKQNFSPFYRNSFPIEAVVQKEEEDDKEERDE